MKITTIQRRALYRSLAIAMLVDAFFLAVIYYREAVQLASSSLIKVHLAHQVIDWPILFGMQLFLLSAWAWWRKNHSLLHGSLLYLMARFAWAIFFAVLLWLNF